MSNRAGRPEGLRAAERRRRGAVRSPRPSVSVRRRPAGVALAPRSPRWRRWLLPPRHGAAEGSAEPLFSGALRQPQPRAPPAPQRPLPGLAGVAVSIRRSRSRGAASVTENARRERRGSEAARGRGRARRTQIPSTFPDRMRRAPSRTPSFGSAGRLVGPRPPHRHTARAGAADTRRCRVTSRPEADGWMGGESRSTRSARRVRGRENRAESVEF